MQKQLQALSAISHEDVKALAGDTGPCVTLWFRTQAGENTASQDMSRLRDTVRQAEGKLKEIGLDKDSIEELLEPVRDLRGDEWPRAHGSLVILRSPDVMRHFAIPVELEDGAEVGENFHLLPILGSLEGKRREFYLLALSQKHVRLLHCTDSSSEEVELPDAMPRSLETWLNTHAPDGASDRADVQDPESGPAGSFNSQQDRDKKDQHLNNFFNAVDKHLSEKLRGKTLPMVVAAVEYELAAYRGINSYEHVVDPGVTGSPDGLLGGELHKRALAAVAPHFAQPLEQALELWEKLGGTERVSSKPDAVVKGAFEARVAHLFVKEGAQLLGRFDRSTLTVGASAGVIENLANTAAMQTIAMGGDVFVVPADKMPVESPIAAVFRY